MVGKKLKSVSYGEVTEKVVIKSDRFYFPSEQGFLITAEADF